MRASWTDGAWKGAWALLALWLIWFSLHNLWLYDYASGYDGAEHFSQITRRAGGAEESPTIYGSSNPPLYYLALAKIWNATGEIKALQAFSLVLYFLEGLLLLDLLRKRAVPRLLQLAVCSYFFFLPLTLNYAYLILNYALANALTIGAFYFMYRHAEKPTVTYRNAAILASVTVGAVLTALTGMAVWISGFLFLMLVSRAVWTKRLALLCVYAGISVAILLPYATKRSAELGCVFCTTHRGAPEAQWLRPYPGAFYLSFDPRVFRQPFYSEDQDLRGLPTYLYATWFGDYWNYLVSPEYVGKTDRAEDHFVGRHSIGPRRARQLQLLLLLGVPVTLLTALVFWRGIVSRTWQKTFWSERSDPRVLSFLFILLTFAQYLVYVHRYRTIVTYHAGYVFPAMFCSCVVIGEVGRDASVHLQRVLAAALLAYAACASWVFYL